MIAPQAIPRSNPDFTVRDIGEETIILSEKGDMLHTLNAVGAFLWRCIDGTRCVQEILARLLEEYEVPESTARADVLRFFEELQEKRLIGWRGES